MTDYTVGDTAYFMFTTRRFSTGAPYALASGAISAYEDASTTQITAGVSLGADHDGVTGLNLVTVVATGGNGFEAGKDYHLVITAGTVDSVSVVGEVVGRFTLQRSAAAVDLANGADGLGALKADTAAILLDTGTDGVVLNAAGLATDAVNEIADGVLNRDMSLGTDSGSATVRTPRQALYFLRNEWVISGTTLTVYKPDGVTVSWTSTITATPGANPITGNDPAGP